MQTSQTRSQATSHKNSTPQSKLLVITREFDVPLDRLFQAFTSADELKKWWWPKGLDADRVDYDFREGGGYVITMKGTIRTAGDASGGMTGIIQEIVPNKRIVMTDRFADDDGNAISAKEAKMPGVWPELIYITFDFEAVDENTSRFTLSQEGIPNELQKDCIQGWSESFDKLETHLKGAKH